MKGRNRSELFQWVATDQGKDCECNSYTYDENGNVVSVKDLQSQTTTYEYDENTNDLLKTILPTGAELTYT